MQYIISQEEYDSLTPVKRLKKRNEALENAKQIILQESKFVCIHDPTVASDNRIMRGYCDDCPISKNIDRTSSKYICILPRNYSK